MLRRVVVTRRGREDPNMDQATTWSGTRGLGSFVFYVYDFLSVSFSFFTFTHSILILILFTESVRLSLSRFPSIYHLPIFFLFYFIRFFQRSSNLSVQAPISYVFLRFLHCYIVTLFFFSSTFFFFPSAPFPLLLFLLFTSPSRFYLYFYFSISRVSLFVWLYVCFRCSLTNSRS